ncbi:MAG: hypothetical protein EXS13_10710 [Planctomycetes bacterium]|nr:hypothetical protein [Planctomycetota bacterium]
MTPTATHPHPARSAAHAAKGGADDRLPRRLPGFLGYKNPGAETIWKGLERLTDITTAYQLFLSTA